MGCENSGTRWQRDSGHRTGHILATGLRVALQCANSHPTGHWTSTWMVCNLGECPRIHGLPSLQQPMEIQHHLGQILEGQHPLQQGVQIPYWGSKTPERLRDNIAVLEYINSSTNFGRFAEEFNNYHGATMEEDQQMEG